jgi:hypothetical protein
MLLNLPISLRTEAIKGNFQILVYCQICIIRNGRETSYIYLIHIIVMITSANNKRKRTENHKTLVYTVHVASAWVKIRILVKY